MRSDIKGLKPQIPAISTRASAIEHRHFRQVIFMRLLIWRSTDTSGPRKLLYNQTTSVKKHYNTYNERSSAVRRGISPTIGGSDFYVQLTEHFYFTQHCSTLNSASLFNWTTVDVLKDSFVKDFEDIRILVTRKYHACYVLVWTAFTPEINRSRVHLQAVWDHLF